jgi:hypothetical protein
MCAMRRGLFVRLAAIFEPGQAQMVPEMVHMRVRTWNFFTRDDACMRFAGLGIQGQWTEVSLEATTRLRFRTATVKGALTVPGVCHASLRSRF